MIPSQQRATILSFDSLFSSAGGIVAQPALGRSADVYGYKTSYLLSAAASALALPFIVLARRAADPADREVAVPAAGGRAEVTRSGRCVTPRAPAPAR